jgi:hypothetical protein
MEKMTFLVDKLPFGLAILDLAARKITMRYVSQNGLSLKAGVVSTKGHSDFGGGGALREDGLAANKRFLVRDQNRSPRARPAAH